MVQLTPPPGWLLEILREDARPAPGAAMPVPPRTACSRGEVRSALYCIPSSISRDEWLQVIFSVYAALNGDPFGLHLVEDWSSRSMTTNGEGKPQYVPGEASEIYSKAMLPEHLPNRRGVDKGTLFALAYKHGWRPVGTALHGAAVPPAVGSGQAPSQLNGMRILTLAEAMTAPPLAWLVAQLLPAIGVGFLAAPPNTGKTAIALDIALRVAHDRDYHGRTVVGGSVIYIASEGLAGLGARAAAWHRAHNLDGLPAGRTFTIVSGAPPLSSASGLAALRLLIEDAARRGQPVRLVVIDTLSGHWAESEDRAEHVAPAMAALQQISAAFTVEILLLHHERKPQAGGSGGGAMAALRGSSAWLGSADFAYSASGDPECVTVTCTKMRDEEKPAPWRVALRRFEYSAPDGSTRSSVVALPAAAPATPSGAINAGEETRLFAAIRELAGSPMTRDGLALKARIQAQRGRALIDMLEGEGRILATPAADGSKKKQYSIPADGSPSVPPSVPYKGRDGDGGGDIAPAVAVRDGAGRRGTAGRRPEFTSPGACETGWQARWRKR